MEKLPTKGERLRTRLTDAEILDLLDNENEINGNLSDDEFADEEEIGDEMIAVQSIITENMVRNSTFCNY